MVGAMDSGMAIEYNEEEDKYIITFEDGRKFVFWIVAGVIYFAVGEIAAHWDEAVALQATNPIVAPGGTGSLAGGTGTRIISVDDVSYGQSSLDKAFCKHSGDFGTYPDGSDTSVELFRSDINNLLINGAQKSGTYRSTFGTHVYNLVTQQWAFFNADGTFNTAFKLSSDQFMYLIETGVVK